MCRHREVDLALNLSSYLVVPAKNHIGVDEETYICWQNLTVLLFWLLNNNCTDLLHV